MEKSDNYLNWSREEFMAYVMSYAARIDVDHSNKEKEFIRSHTVFSNYLAIQKEFKEDNDIDALHKIQGYSQHHDFSMLDRDLILIEIQKMFEFDDEQTAMEEGIISMLRKIFS